MGNYKFGLSEMIPNAWFYKLKKMGNHKSTTNHRQPTKKNHSPPSQPPLLHPTTTRTSNKGDNGPETKPPVQTHNYYCLSHARKSYYFARELNSETAPKSSDSSELFFPPLDPPRKSSTRRRRPTTRKRTTSLPTSSSTTTTATKHSPSSSFSSSVSASYSCRSTANSSRPKPSSPPQAETTISSLPNHHVLPNESFNQRVTLVRYMGDSVSGSELPTIRTERKKFSDSVKQIGGTQEAIDETIKQSKSSVKCRGKGANGSLSDKVVKEKSMASSVFKQQGVRPDRRFPNGSPRVRIRTSSPRIARLPQVNSSKASLSSRKNISSKSLAVVTLSFDPQRDFRESMMEMIVENNIKASKDLEELLACYLSLNSDEYHHIIIEVFRQIWFGLNNIIRRGEMNV